MSERRERTSKYSPIYGCGAASGHPSAVADEVDSTTTVREAL